MTLNPWNADRRKRLFKKQFYSEAHREYISRQPCAVCQRPGYNDPHHLSSKGSGGTWRDLVPLCHDHHVEFHAAGQDTFRERYGTDLRAVADRLSQNPKEDAEF